MLDRADHPHDRKGGGLAVLICQLREETLYFLQFQTIFAHGPLMVKLGHRTRDPLLIHPPRVERLGGRKQAASVEECKTGTRNYNIVVIMERGVPQSLDNSCVGEEQTIRDPTEGSGPGPH